MEDLNPRAVIGSNNPPPYDPDIWSDCAKKVEDFTAAAGEWLNLGTIETQDQSQKATDFVSGARKTYKAIDEARKAAKAPHDEAGKAVQAAFAPLLDKIKLSVDKIAAMQADWLKRENARIAAEKAREAAEAEAKRKEAERLAAEAAARNDVSAIVDAEAAMKEAEKAAKAAARNATASAASATGGGRTMSLRTTYECELINIAHAFQAFRNHPDLADLLVRLANAEVRSQKGEKVAPAGFTLIKKEMAA